jgi:hypothetical protein
MEVSLLLSRMTIDADKYFDWKKGILRNGWQRHVLFEHDGVTGHAYLRWDDRLHRLCASSGSAECVFHALGDRATDLLLGRADVTQWI